MSVRLTRTPDGRIMMVNRNTGTSQVFEPRPQIRPRNTTFSEDLTDLLTPYIGKDTARSLFGKRRVGGGGDILSNIVDDAGLANITPLMAGKMSAGQAIKDFRAGDYGSAAANAAFAGLDLGLSGYGLKQALKTSARPTKSLKSQEKIPNYEDAAHYMRVNEMMGNICLLYTSPSPRD